MDNFSIYESSVTKDDIVVIFTPPKDIVKYVYRVYRDDEVISSHKVSNESSEILLDTSGTFQIKVTGYDKFDKEYVYLSGKYLVDKDAPEMIVGDTIINMSIKDTLNVMGNVKAKDNIDGYITDKVTSNISELNIKQVGRQKLIYTVSDKAGNTTSKEVTININNNTNNALIIGQIAIIVMILVVIKLLSRYLYSMRLEKRFAKYAVEPKEDKSASLFDIIIMFYDSFVGVLNEVINKSKVLVNYAKKYNKYLLFTKDRYNDATSILASKMLLSIVFLLIAFISKDIQSKMLNTYEIIIPLILGFYVLDIIYIFKYKIYRDKIENDLLQAVIIMNNAFKSGRSITQAIELVSNELPGIIGDQFKIMRREMSKGLSIDVVFKRFAERVNVEEVNYLTASLTILNKTGGNIIKVFNSIENSLFMKKKLRLELVSLTSSSKLIMWVLFLLPIMYILIISLLNPTYFEPFFNTSLGIILTTIIVILYVIYIVVVRKILKVRM